MTEKEIQLIKNIVSRYEEALHRCEAETGDTPDGMFTPIYREDCEVLKSAISALSAKPELEKVMDEIHANEGKEVVIVSAEGEYIKKEDALAELNKWDWQELYLPIHFKENILDVLPTYSFPDREKGEWIATENEEMEVDGYFCSKCDSPMPTDEKTSFCPFCGADMRRDKADE